MRPSAAPADASEAAEKAPLLRSGSTSSISGKAIATAVRSGVSAPATFAVLLFAVACLGVGVHVTGGVLERAGERVGEAKLCTFSQLQHGLTIKQLGPDGALGEAEDPALGADMTSSEGLFYSKPGNPLPFSREGNGFKCGAEYENWLKSSAVYTPDQCQLLTPGKDTNPFAGTGFKKVLIVGNSYIFQQITALVSQYAQFVDFARSPSMIQYYPSMNGEQRCKCVRDDAPTQDCVDLFSRWRWENGDGSAKAVANFAGGDGFYEGMQGPPATMGVYRFFDGTEVYAVTNHPLMNSKKFGLNAIANALQINLYEMDALYMNYGNYQGFGKLFCGGQIDDDVVQKNMGEMGDEHIKKALRDGGFHGRLMLTTKTAQEDLEEMFRGMHQASERGEVPWSTILVPFHMHLNYHMCPYVAGDMDENCKGVGCARKTCNIHALDGCTGGEGHSCAPGFADISVNLLLHALRVRPQQYYWGAW
jgi:hypothetical protein